MCSWVFYHTVKHAYYYDKSKDNKPELPYCLYVNIQILYCNPLLLLQGQSVFQVTAIDQDIGVNDDIIYSIERKTQQPGYVKTICFGIKESVNGFFGFFSLCLTDSSADGLFTISSDHGIISVLSEIDREIIGDTVTLTVKVQLFCLTLFPLSLHLS